MRPARRLLGLSRLAAATALFAAAAVAPAAAEGPTETLKTLYRIALSAEMCGFPIAPRQSEALGRSMNRALAESGLDEAAADQLYLDVDSALEAEGWTKVCAADGDGAHGWRAALAANAR